MAPHSFEVTTPQTSRDHAAETDDAAAEVRDQQAQVDETAANERDRDAEIRDAVAADRDQAAADPMVPHPPAAMVRRQAAEDRQGAAADRASAIGDRGRASSQRKLSRADRERAAGDRAAATDAITGLKALLVRAEGNAEDMMLIGQAQGVLMEKRGLDHAAALLELCAEATRGHVELGDAARNIADPH